MINNYPEYENSVYQMDEAHNNAVFHKIELVYRVLHKEVALTREYIFIHAVKGLLSPDLKEQVTDSNILSQLSQLSVDEQGLKAYYKGNTEDGNKLITLYLELMGKSMKHLVLGDIDYIVGAIEASVDEAGAVLMHE